jgi:hypothetical protein
VEEWRVVASNFMREGTRMYAEHRNERNFTLRTGATEPGPLVRVGVTDVLEDRSATIAVGEHTSCRCRVMATSGDDRVLVVAEDLFRYAPPLLLPMHPCDRGQIRTVYDHVPTTDDCTPWVELVQDIRSSKRVCTYRPPSAQAIVDTLSAIPGFPLAVEGVLEIVAGYAAVEWK